MESSIIQAQRLCTLAVALIVLLVLCLRGDVGLLLKGDSHISSDSTVSVSQQSRLVEARLNPVLSIVRSLKREIRKTWAVDEFPLFLSIVNVPEASWAIQKSKFVNLLLSTSAENRQKFVIGFSGSSVTAGHDNFFSEAFPSVINRTLADIFSMAGLTLEVRNGAFGNNPCCPYDNCLETHLGDDLDIMAWEQSMNCGRDPRPVETFIRSAARMPKRPSVWFITSGTPYWAAEDCDATTTAATTTTATVAKKLINATTLTLIEGKGWIETKTAVSAAALATPGSSAFEKALLGITVPAAAASQSHLANFTFLQIKTSTPGKMLNLAQMYSGVAPLGQNVQVIEGYRCQGPYGSDFSVKTPGGGQKWHPGKRGHQLRGDSLSFYLLSVLEEALVAIVNNGEANAATAAKQVLELEQAKVLSNPLVCPPEECDSAPKCFTNYEPRVKNSITDILLDRPGPHNNWTVDISFFDKAAVTKAASRGLGYLDKKVIFTSGTVHKPLTMHISPKRNKSFLLVCEVQKGFNKYPPGMGDLDHSVAVLLYENVVDKNGNQVHWTAQQQQPAPPPLGDATPALELKKKASVTHLSLKHYMDQCYRTDSVIKPGNHVVAFVQRHQDVRVNLAYVVYW